MKNYPDFQLEDFLTDESFGRWIRQQSSPDEAVFWQAFARQHPEKSAILAQARVILTSLTVRPHRDLSDEDLAEQARQIRFRTRTITQRPTSRWQTAIRRPDWLRAVGRWAAGVVLLAGLGWLGWHLTHIQQTDNRSALARNPQHRLIRTVNHTSTPLTIPLSDSSVVVLQPHSQISYAPHFGATRRQVYLVGEAFFQVKKNPKKPFYVHTNALVTKVLGTSFTVRAYSRMADVQVSVRTGKVSVVARKDWQQAEKVQNADVPGVVLTPNQRVVFDRKEGHFHRMLAPDPVIVDQHFQPQTFRYDERPIREVFGELEKAYGIRIVFDEQLLSQCTLTARLGDESLLEKISLICKTIKASYQIVDAQIVINARGCD